LLVTVLTGYRDFSYAQEAVRLGVHRLLLKPSRMDEINEAMSSMSAILRERPPEDESVDRNNSASSYIVRRALSYIEDNHQTKLSLQEVADHCYVSQWHLSKLLNKHTGKKYYDLLNAARIEAAKRLLRDSTKEHLTIADISEAVGYSDTGHFSRSFKKLIGVSANEYRNG
ncbi:MAG: helix-turn-helix domain-containing protein, partial [Clostridiaceae bacterium]|nr:helix-turn-helix domain-containing protein [Clostridiaceae bacterium]